MSRPKIIAIDESGSISDPSQRMMVVVSNVSYDMGDLRRKSLGQKNRGGYRVTAPRGEFLYLALYNDMVAPAGRIYGEPSTTAELSLNGNFYQYMLRKDGILKLMEAVDFSPRDDVVVVDAFCNTSMLIELISLGWQRTHDEEVPRRVVRCEHGADMIYLPVRMADENALRLVDRWTHDDYGDEKDPCYTSRMVSFGLDDVVRLNLNRHQQREIRALHCYPQGLPATA